MKHLLLFILFLATSSVFSQDNKQLAVPSEISFRNNHAYFNGYPFTGIVIDEKTNKEIGEYKNGRKDGSFFEWYPNGKKKIENRYANGIQNGLQTEWFENGKKKYEGNYLGGGMDGKQTEWFSNGQLRDEYNYVNGSIANGKYVVYLENGEWDKEETYLGGQKTGEAIYKEGLKYELITEYYPNSRVKKSEGQIKNDQKDGQWKQWFENGQIMETGHFKDGKMNSIWVQWYPNGEKKREAVYLNDDLESLIYENNTDPSLSINVNFKQGALLFHSLFGTEDDTDYVMVLFNFQQNNEYKAFANLITKALEIRFDQISESQVSEYGKKLLKYTIEFSNPTCTVIYDDGKSSVDLVIATLNSQATPGYRGKASISIKITDLKNQSVIFNQNISGQTEIYTDKYFANSIAPKAILQPVIDKTFQKFKVKTRVNGIIERDRNGYAKTVEIMCGENLSLGKGFQFQVYSDEDLNHVLGKIKVLESQKNTSKCKVIEGEFSITNHLQSGKKLTTISIY